VDGKDKGKGAPISCAMIYGGQHYQRFEDDFIQFCAVVDLRALRGKRIGDYDRIPEPVLLDEY